LYAKAGTTVGVRPAANAPPLPPHQPPSLESISARMKRMELKDNFYQYTLHQQRQDPNLYPWPTPELFRATVAWPEEDVMQSYPVRALVRRLQVDWARDPRKGPRVLMSLRVDFEPMG